MAKPNYSFEKRQRELAKKQKKEEKLRRKAAGGQAPDDEPAADETVAVGGQDGAPASTSNAGEADPPAQGAGG